MKTEKEKIAEIASDVRKATRERAEAEHAEEKALKRELEKEKRAKQKLFHEKFADFYLKLAILFITSSVVISLLLIKNIEYGCYDIFLLMLHDWGNPLCLRI